MIKDKEVSDLKQEKMKILEELKQAYELNVRVVNDIIELMNITNLGQQSQRYIEHQL